ncbi:putative glutamine amidotransferase [Gottschalkia purinilytica]|uniref:Putative glutamine amidotransferase n=1 Tax=Gottschalkia purinilytica TaxID=1503 RepID=A0A0L0WF28_GOTPU|nr:gamma-glutamyl-gamma-aminobutyrate hydrolase family protein [Gottschalkia purinilytica]KNF10031.1 putative glutamine amidotransferase [Gottschalkia purinilytica]
MKKPLIGVAGSTFNTINKLNESVEKIFVNTDYIRCVEEAGGTPIILPLVYDNEMIKKQVSICDGILMCGGLDANPMYYNEEPHQKLGWVNTTLDEYQIQVIKATLDIDKPLLAICRGHQLLNVACGGSLYQDLCQVPRETLKHKQDARRHEYCHEVNISQNSKLGKILGENAFVNSFHHQAIKDLGENLSITAVANDGIAEAIEMKERKFVLGVQWHPECMALYYNNMMNIFKEFIQNCN